MPPRRLRAKESLAQPLRVPNIPLDIVRLIVAELACQLEDVGGTDGPSARSVQMLRLMRICRGWRVCSILLLLLT
jgi:hypothetical protein